ncbi:hypothetical protein CAUPRSCDRAFT_3293, partial [Caulochytrium protostelioides]
MCPDRSLFTDLQPLPCPVSITLGDQRNIQATHSGSIKMRVTINGAQQALTMGRVLYVPRLGFSLISVHALMAQGWAVTFTDDKCLITQGS